MPEGLRATLSGEFQRSKPLIEIRSRESPRYGSRWQTREVAARLDIAEYVVLNLLLYLLFVDR